MGCIYQRGEIFWIKYYRNGKPYCESTRSTDEGKAKKLLKTREGEIAEGELPGICFDKIRFDELAKDLVTDQTINQKRQIFNESQNGCNSVTIEPTPKSNVVNL